MKNDLKYLEEFKKVLENYHISDNEKAALNSVELVLMASPSAVGRNTVISKLIKTGNYHFIVSDTTRLPRTNNGVKEVNGSEYWFISEEEFLNGLKENRYLEAALIHDQQVSGISMKEIDRASREHKVAITDIEVQGVETILSVKPDAHAIFLLPPSFEEWMKRLSGRGLMSDIEKRRRLNSAIREYDYAVNSNYYTFLIAENVEITVENINKIVNGNSLSKNAQAEGKKLAKELLEQTKKALAKSN